MSGIGAPELLILFAIGIILILTVWPSARICQRAGFPPWIGFLAIVPIAGLCLLWFLAFAPWPALKSRAGG
jgi:hypothetical protein